MAFYLPGLEEPTTRELVERQLDEAFYVDVAETLGIDDSQEVRGRLVHILTRYEVYRANERQPTGPQLRKALAGPEKALFKALEKLDDLDPDTLETLDFALNEQDPNRWERFSLNSPLPEPKHTIDTSIEAMSASLRAIRQVRSQAHHYNKPSRSKAPALDQLIIDLESLHDEVSDRPARSACYYDTVQGRFVGAFLELVSSTLDAYERGSYQSKDALAQRIRRVLQFD